MYNNKYFLKAEFLIGQGLDDIKDRKDDVSQEVLGPFVVLSAVSAGSGFDHIPYFQKGHWNSFRFCGLYLHVTAFLKRFSAKGYSIVWALGEDDFYDGDHIRNEVIERLFKQKGPKCLIPGL